MKTLKMVGCLLLIVSALAYAAKTTYTVAGVSFIDMRENLKKGWVPVYTNIEGIAVVRPVDPLKSQIVIVGAVADSSLMVEGGAKVIKTKLPKNTFAHLKNVGAIANANDIGPGGVLPAPVAKAIVDKIQLKGVNVGTVFANALNMVQADSIVSLLGDAGKKGKGVKIQANAKVGAFIGGTGLADLGQIVATLKGLDSKGTMGFLDLTAATPIKPGKTLVKAKIPNTNPVYGNAAAWKAKNVTITAAP